MEWTIYTARGITRKNSNGIFSFDSSQIEDGLKIGLMPQILINAGVGVQVVQDLAKYLNRKNFLKKVPIQITAHGFGEFGNDYKNIEQTIETIIDINKNSKKSLVSEVVFHGGSVFDFESLSRWHNDDKINSPIDLIEYTKIVEFARMNLSEYVSYASRFGIDVILENVGQVNFAVAKSLDEKTEEQRRDPRWGNTLWLPEKAQYGDIGCVYDLEKLTKGYLCIDTEHLHQSAEYSRTHNLENFPKELTEAEKLILRNHGVFIREKEPVLFEKAIDPFELIRGLSGRIKIAHLGGQVSQIYDDNGVMKIGSHMPITFVGQDNEYYDDKELLHRHNCARETGMYKYLSALNDAGCRKAVLELHLGNVYTGPKWQHYNKVSLDNVSKIIRSFK
ncbi:hypothetical protein JXM83_03055 [Candidatus Woesearchaeota archaeon]|nr:hypothetical protein [Candidatus Woesearchaeota archaeon]